MIKQDFYTVKEIAEANRVSPRQIQKIIKRGDLPYYQNCPGGKILVSHEDYTEWLLQRRKPAKTHS